SSGTTTLTLATNDYTTITVSKGATLVLDSQSGPMTLRATGAITISGTVTFAGKNGVHGVHGKTAPSAPYYQWEGPLASGSTRLGALGRNGGGNGGNSGSCASSTSSYRVA